MGKLKHGGDGHSFIPIFREPSSIEKILGEAEREHHFVNYKRLSPPKASLPHLTSSVPPPPPLRTASLKADASPRASSSLRVASFPSQRVASPPRATTPINVANPAKTPPSRFVQQHRRQPTLNERHLCATKIQAAYRGYTARRNYRALRGLVRLQGVVKGQSVKWQTANALKCMQLMVRVQNQINSRRIQMLENQVQQRQTMHNKNDKDLESAFGKWNLSESMDEWEDSTLTKEEIDARMHRKVDAIVKRERAMAYAYSQQLWKATPGMAQAALMDLRSGGFPHWRNWLEQRNTPPTTLTNNPSQSPAIKTPHFTPTPTRPTLGFSFKTSPLPPSGNLRLNQPGLRFDNMDTPTPRSTKSTLSSRTKQAWTPPGRLQQRYTYKDDDSLMSCPPFSVPHYMAPTASAKAKVRSEKARVPESPSSTVYESKRRVLFPFGQAVGSFKWKNKERSGSQKGLERKNNQSMQSLADHLSVDSTVSMPATVGRKPFNRFV